jgi:hypothetical protein
MDYDDLKKQIRDKRLGLKSGSSSLDGKNIEDDDYNVDEIFQKI